MSETDGEVSVNKALRFYDESRVRLSEVDSLAELREDILRASFQKGAVQLDSGVEQPYFFEKYLIVARPTILRRLSRFLAARIPAGTDRIAAPTLGAVAIGTAVSLETGLPLAIVRSGEADGSARRSVEGGLHPGEIVILIEDVVVTGQRALAAVRTLREAGVTVTAVVSVIDCGRGAAARFAEEGLDYDPLFQTPTLLPKGSS